MSNHIHIFAIGRNYRNCRIFTAERRTKQRVGTSTITLNPGLPRRQRYDEIVKFLTTGFKLPVPAYVPSKRESRPDLNERKMG
jgi:hypothetical protein